MDDKYINKQKFYTINQWWRLFATALGFIIFGLFGLFVLSLIWFSLLRLFVWKKQKRIIIAQYSISISFKVFLWIVKSLCIFNYQFNEVEKLKQDDGCLIVANHPSLLDVVLLVSVMRRCDCLVKGALLNNLFISRIIKTAGYILNGESGQILPQCNEILSNKGRILIFPEGTRSIPNHPITLQRGAANIALRCHADIRIIHIQCNPPWLIKKQKWYDIPEKKALFNITVGEKIKIDDFLEENTTVAARKLTRHLTTLLTLEP
ncbi:MULTISPECIES: lysophospholipid acyltransferase family protein [unclassified Gilliamella]|uniref:lysophospholipid acyltransferase family protein n=1 Tax=unclassified Gilliamella TaxID=2685620 RepID=UPI00226AD7D1|nr:MULTISPECIES: lysophospholipid acyltransferase family protein [unclassified Gilliamella]MCX8584557.1 1-acyl-sn-glycerol-3-phosphate acyltransferase [Gilliamella sp. B3372]MCX8584938.1 1-acyl-sn-glycerol-3-phosphate acyltransferase [Gilliamella sp. B3562]MCX8593696.1 1-acyl-sn-glycerol-3-phosphate acyltransferase [Gilliamella sp. B3367]MCX8661866.1 1-acyl-sn-glycerol-3-phosphate acyltransferase [Gilliamella sp. B2911]MCX8670122.1 1-acyl-sn-glycerol-3-phosphate acyltransferase [Gilliamella sp